MILFSSIHKNRHVHHNGFGAVIAVLTSLIILACGDDSVENVTQVMQGDVQIISEVSELPKCAVENEGELFFVKNESSMRVCSEGKWYATMLPIMASCTTAKLADETGVKILCGGDSVGVVLNGKDGKNGLDGKDGKDGADGKDGVQGAQGEKGDVGATGEKGDKGDKGDSGVAGKDGADGRDGNGCTVVTLTDNSGLKVLCGGDSVGVVLNGKDGAQGEKGDKGDTGEKGDKGDSGATGKQGDKGDKGDYGASGTGCSLTQEGTVVTITCGDKSSTLDMGTESDSVGGMKPVVLNSEKIAVSLDEVSGVTQKGPFLMGSRVLVREMEDGRTLTQTGNSFNGKILNDKGEFKINARMLVSQYVMLEASGYYRNEITGENSNSELTLFAITDVNYRNIVNVNLLTHLEYERVIYLVTKKKMKVQEAKRQAQKEILGILDIDATDFSNSEDLNIAGASNEDGALLALSVLFQGDRSVSQLSELLTKISIDMEEDGEWNDTKTKIAIADWAAAGDSSNRFTSIRNNVASWKLSSVVPNFEKHIRHFWNVEYGLNDCSKERLGEVIAASAGKAKGTNTRFICVDSSGIGHMWRIATDHDKDTYKWTAGKDGDSKLGNINTKLCYVYEDSVWRLGNTSDCSLKLRGCTALRQDTVGLGSDNVWHICDSKSWRNATTYEKDTFGWKNGTDGEIKKGNVTDTVYVFDKTSWRATSAVEGKLGGCVEAIADSVGKVGSTYYICKSGVWATATVLEYDTYKWSVGKDGDSKSGSVNANNCYVYENKAWRRGNSNDCSLGLRGCTALRQDTVGKGSDKVWHICDSKSWRNATTYEKDTFGWKNGTDGEIKKGNVTDTVYVFDKTSWRATSAVEGKLGGCVEAIADSVGKVGSTYYICKSGSWRTATALEYDTYKWSAGKDGDSKSGSVNANNCYVYENKAWRSGNASDCSLGMRGCTALRQDTVGKGSDKVWHICDAKTWRNATTYEKDTFGWTKGTDGEIKKGNVTDSIYVFDKTAWRATSAVEAKLGGCVSAIADSVGKVGSTYYICKSGKWTTATALQYDTYRWTAGKDGDSKVGSVNANNCYVYENKAWRSGNASDCSLSLRGCTALRQDTVGKGSDKMWYICDSKSWRNATTFEKDTFGWKKGTDGEIKKGNVTDSIYVFDKTAWRATTNVETKLGGCVAAIADSVGKVGSSYYICKSGAWITAAALEYDTYRWSAGKDGDSRVGSVNAANCYVYENSAWRNGNATDCSLGLRGCTALRQDTVGKGSDKMWYICDSKSWRNATNIEMDTATWGAGKFDGEVRVGQVNKSVYYIYETSKKSWRNATTLEKDTYDFTNNKKWPTGTDGEIKKGSITDSIYVYDATVWRTADNIEKVLGGCVTAIADSVGKVGSTYYICTPRKWNIATALQYDTYKKECLTDGSIVDGNVISPNKYVCDDGVFRLATENDLRAELGCTNYTRGEYRILSGQYSYYKCEIDGWIFTTEKLNQGIMTDERDGKEYKTIGIGPQMWMAENLNYADENNYPSMKDRNQCYNDDCVKYGRLYIWSAVIDSVYWAQRNKKCGYEEDVCGLPDIVQGICPDKWHVPNSNEWLTLYATMNNNARAMQAKGYSNWKKATDEYGFSALPIPYVCDAGIWCSDESSYVEGGYGLNWCIEKETARLFYHYDDHRYLYYSVRCVKD